MMAPMALENLSRPDLAAGRIAADRTGKAVRPAKLKQRSAAFFLCTILVHEIRKTHAFLELNFILRHVDTSLFLKVIFLALR